MPTAPFDTVETVLNTARVRLNDAIQSIAGDVLTDLASFTPVAANAAWRRLQEMLVDFGFPGLTQEIILGSLPAVTQADLGGQVWMDWTGYNDGTTLQASFPLPQNLISPLDLWERVHGGTGQYIPMDRIFNGLPTVPKQTLNRIWEWRGEAIRMPGATFTTDLRIRYAAYLADFTGPTWTASPVPIMRALNPLAWLICSEVAKARGDLDAGYFEEKAAESTVFIYNRNPARGKMPFKEAEGGKMTDKYTPASQQPVRGVESKRG